MNEHQVQIANKRLDQYCMEFLQVSRSKVQKMLEQGLILVNGKQVKNGYSTKIGDLITFHEYQEEQMLAEPEPMNLDIVYEDEDLLVVNKENKMVVHPAPGHYHHTLVNGLLYHAKSLSQKNGAFRPGIVHRIDADTTGLLVVAKNDEVHESLSKQLEEKTTHRKYIALVWGVIDHDTGTIKAPIARSFQDRKKMAVVAGGKDAITHFKVIKRYQDVTLIEVVLETGRTHQIRVHMQYIGYPIVNDPVYGTKKLIDETGQCLHAMELGFVHPKTKQYMEFSTPLPSCFFNILKQFEE